MSQDSTEVKMPVRDFNLVIKEIQDRQFEGNNREADGVGLDEVVSLTVEIWNRQFKMTQGKSGIWQVLFPHLKEDANVLDLREEVLECGEVLAEPRSQMEPVITLREPYSRFQTKKGTYWLNREEIILDQGVISHEEEFGTIGVVAPSSVQRCRPGVREKGKILVKGEEMPKTSIRIR